MLDVLSNPALKLRHYRNIVALPALSTATKRHDHCLWCYIFNQSLRRKEWCLPMKTLTRSSFLDMSARNGTDYGNMSWVDFLKIESQGE